MAEKRCVYAGTESRKRCNRVEGDNEEAHGVSGSGLIDVKWSRRIWRIECFSTYTDV